MSTHRHIGTPSDTSTHTHTHTHTHIHTHTHTKIHTVVMDVFFPKVKQALPLIPSYMLS